MNTHTDEDHGVTALRPDRTVKSLGTTYLKYPHRVDSTILTRSWVVRSDCSRSRISHTNVRLVCYCLTSTRGLCFNSLGYVRSFDLTFFSFFFFFVRRFR